MSYDVTAWDPLATTLPKTWDDVLRSVRELDGRVPGLNEKFIRLAQELESTNVGLDRDPTGRDASMYGFGRIVGGARTCKDGLFRFSLPRSHAVQLLFVAVDHATALASACWTSSSVLRSLPMGASSRKNGPNDGRGCRPRWRRHPKARRA